MTSDELRAYVDGQWPEDPKAYSDDGQFVRVSYEEVPPPASIAASLRYLLARRLAREGKYATARPYFPPHERGVIADYASALAAGGIRLSVRDNGSGIADTVFGRIFEPYVTTKPKGTGLGLAIVKKIIDEHHGQILVENLKPHGAHVSIVLPLREAA